MEAELARALAKQEAGDWAGAEQLLRDALRDLPPTPLEPRAALLRELARLQQAQGRLGEAARTYREAEALLRLEGAAPADHPTPRRRKTDSVSFMLGEQGEQLIRLLNRVLDQELELEPLLELVTGLLIEATGAERGFFMLTGPDGQPPDREDFLYARHFDASEVAAPQFAISRGIVREAVTERRGIIVKDAIGDERFSDQSSVVALRLKSVLCVPVLHEAEALGAIYLEHRNEADRFHPSHVALVEHLADRVAGLVRGSLRQRRRIQALAQTNDAYRRSLRRLGTRYAFDQIIGSSEAMQAVYAVLDRVVETQAHVLIQGESGTGKELIARAIHFNSPRRDRPFQVLHCLGLAEGLVEAELYGYEQGAFTGADQARIGLYEAADGGTLLLDEVTGMSPALQGSLLRVLQEGEVRPLGARAARKVDVRILAIANRELLELVSEGRFREDLYWRLNVVRVLLPPLRQRRSDIPLLARHFQQTFYQQQGLSAPGFTEAAMRQLQAHPWPGNVRELRNTVQRATVLYPGQQIGPEDLSFEDPIGEGINSLTDICGLPYQEAKKAFGEHYVRLSLIRNRDNVSTSARESGMQRQAFQRLMRSFHIERHTTPDSPSGR